MIDHVADVRKYSAIVNEAAVAAIVKYCGIALQKTDSSLVATSDTSELATIRQGYAAKRLGLGVCAAEPGSC
jgi:hypothetical protein